MGKAGSAGHGIPFASEEDAVRDRLLPEWFVMVVELFCANCPCCFSAAPETPHEEVVQRMIDAGPWFALAAGPTFEDMIFTALARRGRILCPDCGTPVAVHESSFGSLATACCAG